MNESLTSRQKRIIITLAGCTTSASSSYIAQVIKVSSRTIRNEIKTINMNIGLNVIIGDNHGFFINHKYEKLIQNLVQNSDVTDKQYVVLKQILFARKPINFIDLADQNYLSESSLQNIIISINDEIIAFNLKILRREGNVCLQGQEKDKRILINTIITKEIDPIFLNIDNCAAYFPNIDIEKIKNAVASALANYNFYIDNFYLTNFYINLMIIIDRANFSTESNSTDKYANIVESAIAENILYNYFSTDTIPTHLVEEVTRLLIGQIKPKNRNEIDQKERIVLTPGFITELRNILNETFNYYRLTINCEDFLKVFALHVYEMLKRCKNEGRSTNAEGLTASIKYTCPYIYDVATYIANKLEDVFNVHISEDEIALISIHIGFSIEDSFKSPSKARIYLICSNYSKIASNIINEIKLNYDHDIEIAGIFESIKKNSNILESDGLIVSTIPFETVRKNTCIISPFFTADDRDRINEAIKNYLSEINNQEFKDLINVYFYESQFFISNKYDTKDQAINFLCKNVEKNGIVGKDFIASVKLREEQSSTCFFGKFAIPHALFTTESKKSSFCILLSHKGIKWDDSTIPLVLLITVNREDRKNFKAVYDGVIRCLLNEDTYIKLTNAKSFAEFSSIFMSSIIR